MKLKLRNKIALVALAPLIFVAMCCAVVCNITALLVEVALGRRGK